MVQPHFARDGWPRVSAAHPKSLTRHATERAGQRAVRPDAVAAALTWGTEFDQPLGRTAFYIDAAAIQRAAKAGDDIARWAATAVVAGPDGGIITVIRTQDVQRLKRFGHETRRRPAR